MKDCFSASAVTCLRVSFIVQYVADAFINSRFTQLWRMGSPVDMRFRFHDFVTRCVSIKSLASTPPHSLSFPKILP